MNKPAEYYDGINRKLFDLIPPNASNVLELGCANGRLGGAFKSTRRKVKWTGIDVSADALQTASKSLDRTIQFNLNTSSLRELEFPEKFDAVIMGDLLEHMIEPETLLFDLGELTTKNATLVCCLPNMAHISVVHRLLTGDMTYDTMGLLDKTHLRLYSHPSAFKVFLDAGWLPNLRDRYDTEIPNSEFTASLLQTAATLGIPAGVARYNLSTYQMLIECKKWQPGKRRNTERDGGLAIIVPVNRQWEFDLNVARSPGLQEIKAEIIPVQNASSAAAAFHAGRKRTNATWSLFLHQDVYIPKGAGFALMEQLEMLSAQGKTTAPVGFAGLVRDQSGGISHSGLVIDRRTCFNFPSGEEVIALDEFALALHKKADVSIDPALGWHTWATDLCLQSRQSAAGCRPTILRIPFFHNSLNDGVLDESYKKSAHLLMAKYPDIGRIETLNGPIVRKN